MLAWALCRHKAPCLDLGGREGRRGPGAQGPRSWWSHTPCSPAREQRVRRGPEAWGAPVPNTGGPPERLPPAEEAGPARVRRPAREHPGDGLRSLLRAPRPPPALARARDAPTGCSETPAGSPPSSLPRWPVRVASAAPGILDRAISLSLKRRGPYRPVCSGLLPPAARRLLGSGDLSVLLSP